MTEDEHATGPGDESGAREAAVVLDYLPHGRAEDDRPQYEKQPLANALAVEEFDLYELVLEDGATVAIGDTLDVFDDRVEVRNRVSFDDLSTGATSELEYAVDDLVNADESRFVDFYNDAQPISLRLHQLNLLPGIGKKLRNGILDERKRRPFESFDDVESRVSGLHNPREVLVERIIEEVREGDLKYRTFARREG